MISLPCPHCDAKLKVRDELAGKRVRCSQCKAPVDVPVKENSSADAATLPPSVLPRHAEDATLAPRMSALPAGEGTVPWEGEGPIQDMPLISFSLSVSEITDLSPLKGRPLEELQMFGCWLTKDLSSLAGMKLKKVRLENNCGGIQSHAVFEGMPIEHLKIGIHCGPIINNLQFLKGMPLKYRDLTSVALRDITPLEGMPLEVLALGHGTNLASLGPCAACRSSRWI